MMGSLQNKTPEEIKLRKQFIMVAIIAMLSLFLATLSLLTILKSIGWGLY